MKALRRKFSSLPTPLMVVFCISLVVPLTSFFFIGNPVYLLLYKDLSKAILLVFAYWLGPTLLCYAAFRRSFAFILIFLLEWAALFAHALLDSSHLTPEMDSVRFGLLAGMVLFCFIFIRKDFLFPIMSEKKEGGGSFPG